MELQATRFSVLVIRDRILPRHRTVSRLVSDAWNLPAALENARRNYWMCYNIIDRHMDHSESSTGVRATDTERGGRANERRHVVHQIETCTVRQ
jgi:hypothetical protein